jgi:SAM-dependent methyltransferase
MDRVRRQSAQQQVRHWYRDHHLAEWERLETDAYHQLEHLVTWHFLDRHLPRGGCVLDAGGGPGRYGVELARAGHDVVLLDLVPEMLDVARARAARARVKRRFRAFLEGSIADLKALEDASFDAVLCLGGPLSHVLDARERRRAAAELVRVARPGAPILVSVIGRLALLRGMLTAFPEQLRHAHGHWSTGDYVPGVNGEGFTAAHWFLPEELRALFEEQDVDVLEMAGLEGLSSLHAAETNRLRTDAVRWRQWKRILLETCTHPAVVGNSEHFLLVARKRFPHGVRGE